MGAGLPGGKSKTRNRVPLGPDSVPGVELAGSRRVMRSSTSLPRCLAEMLCTGVGKARVSSLRRLFAKIDAAAAQQNRQRGMASLGQMAFFHLELHWPRSLEKNTRPRGRGLETCPDQMGGLCGDWGNGLLTLLPGVTPPYFAPA